MDELTPKLSPGYDMDQIHRDYLDHLLKFQESSSSLTYCRKKVIIAFGNYLEKSEIVLTSINIEHVDDFLARFNAPYAKSTQGVYRSCLRGFLHYLYNERHLLQQNLAQLVTGPPVFAKAKPPKFLRPGEIRQLFDHLPCSTSKELRVYAQVHLAYYLGLRPIEISRITLDDICFTKGLLNLKNRKNTQPLQLPIPDEVIKAITAYIVGGRPKSQSRFLFLTSQPPSFRPVNAWLTRQNLTNALRDAGLPGTGYWLRHTFAQNMLEAGAGIFEIKEMMGHSIIDSTKKYLSIHKELMRRVLFDETV